MLEYVVPESQRSLAGELREPGITVFWRIGPAGASGTPSAVMAQKCERQPADDSYVSLSGEFPGDMDNREQVDAYLQRLNSMFRCLQEPGVAD
jgi:hypothetical protein